MTHTRALARAHTHTHTHTPADEGREPKDAPDRPVELLEYLPEIQKQDSGQNKIVVKKDNGQTQVVESAVGVTGGVGLRHKPRAASPLAQQATPTTTTHPHAPRRHSPTKQTEQVVVQKIMVKTMVVKSVLGSAPSPRARAEAAPKRRGPGCRSEASRCKHRLRLDPRGQGPAEL